MKREPFNFSYDANADCYDLVVDKKIQAVVDDLCALPHDILIRYLTYWSDTIDSNKYVVESDLPHDEWFSDCYDYADSETDEQRYLQAKCLAQTLGHMLQDIKCNHPNKYPAAMRTVKSWKKYHFIGFAPTMREDIDKAWIEPKTLTDGEKATKAYAPLLKIFMQQYEDGKMKEAAGNAFYLLERLARLFCKTPECFGVDKGNYSTPHELLLEAVCHILSFVMSDKRTDSPLRNAMIWHISTIDMLYGQFFKSQFFSFDDFMCGDVTKDTFVYAYNYLVKI